jgi:hypothetical protein
MSTCVMRCVHPVCGVADGPKIRLSVLSPAGSYDARSILNYRFFSNILSKKMRLNVIQKWRQTQLDSPSTGDSKLSRTAIVVYKCIYKSIRTSIIVNSLASSCRVSKAIVQYPMFRLERCEDRLIQRRLVSFSNTCFVWRLTGVSLARQGLTFTYTFDFTHCSPYLRNEISCVSE